jgi:phosphoenolpyruvate-protein kinase (PTS system EI component)
MLFDKAVIVSADSDLLPVIKAIERIAPEKEIGVMFPIGRTNYELRQNASFRLKMTQKLLQESQFPEQVRLGSTVIARPIEWR